MSVVRHCVTAGGIALAGKGIISTGSEGAFVDHAMQIIGLLMAGTGIASGVAQKVQENVL